MLHKNFLVFAKYRRIRAFAYYLFVYVCFVSEIKSAI